MVGFGLLLGGKLAGMGVAGGNLRRLIPPCIFSVCLLSAFNVKKWVLHKMAIAAMSWRSNGSTGVFSRDESSVRILSSSSLTVGVKQSAIKSDGSWLSDGLNLFHVLPSFLASEDSSGTTCGIVAPGAVYPAMSPLLIRLSETVLVSVNTIFPSHPRSNNVVLPVSSVNL